jgi:2-hydroxychromene-2-carboxylate isomerase
MNQLASANARPALEIWFEFGSNYSYLSVMRVEDLSLKWDVPIVWKPFLLGPIFRKFGWESSPFVLQAQKGAYMWIDMARQAKKYGLDFRKPTDFPRLATLPMRVATLGATQPWMGRFCKAVMRQNWVDDVDINTPPMVHKALSGLVPDPETLIMHAQQANAKQLLRDQTEEAARRGIFGGPTFFVGDEMFWGNDRLDDAFALASDLANGSQRESPFQHGDKTDSM